MILILIILSFNLFSLTLSASVNTLIDNPLLVKIESDKPNSTTLTTWKRAEVGANKNANHEISVVESPPHHASTSSASFEVIGSGGNSSPLRCKGCVPGISISEANKARFNKVFSKSKSFFNSMASQPKVFRGRTGAEASSSRGYTRLK